MSDGKNFTSTFSLTDEIADIIRDRILTGEYVIGEKIKENQIATELRVSRTPIREAFKQLENEGLIDYIPNRGCFAKGFTRQDIEDIYAVRKALEILAVEWAVKRITPEGIKKMEDQCELMEFYTRRKEEQKVLDINTDFHDIIYNATGSRFMAQILRSYKEYIEQTRKAIFYEQSYLEAILEEHYEILSAIKSKDIERSKKAMADHLDCSQKRAEMIYNIKD